MSDAVKTVVKKGRKRKQPQISNLYITLYGEYDGVGMGCLSDDSLYLTQRGLARLCGVQNAHIGTISTDWHTDKPRIRAIKARLETVNENRPSPHRVMSHKGRIQHTYDMAMCRAILGYYAFDAGRQTQPEAEAHLRTYDGAGLEAYVRHGLSMGLTPAEGSLAQPIRFQPIADEPEIPVPQADALSDMIRAYYDLSFMMAQAYVAWLSTLMQRAAWNNRLGLYVPLRAFLTS
ncbi:hypothetical protein [Asticcacaulis endophyticus]|uniref:Uncharacterized protein n=1 Tax=Asticcacaulis endophyticus TaxID=1395890 RepID=A0A918PUT0_9CAUL|nr:hypothetical protein [Asticcacaulis endophyticus]GGZ23487.1 hypothetical protein GCM10011273_05630 [Asticcacaulis endophyticus]